MPLHRFMNAFWLSSFALCSAVCHAKGSADHELSLSYHYESGKGPKLSYFNHEMVTALLVPYGPFYIGGELTYIKVNTPSNSFNVLEIGGITKYWIVERGNSVGFNIYLGAGLGRQEFGESKYTSTTLKVGPELAWFITDNASISTRFQYAMRKAEEPYTSLGFHSGLSLFF